MNWKSGHRIALESARLGLNVAGCARAAGVDRDTVYQWQSRDPAYRDAFVQARMEGDLFRVQQAEDYLHRAYTDQPLSPAGLKAALRTLEALNPAKWSPRHRVTLESIADGDLLAEMERRLKVMGTDEAQD